MRSSVKNFWKYCRGDFNSNCSANLGQTSTSTVPVYFCFLNEKSQCFILRFLVIGIVGGGGIGEHSAVDGPARRVLTPDVNGPTAFIVTAGDTGAVTEDLLLPGVNGLSTEVIDGVSGTTSVGKRVMSWSSGESGARICGLFWSTLLFDLTFVSCSDSSPSLSASSMSKIPGDTLLGEDDLLLKSSLKNSRAKILRSSSSSDSKSESSDSGGGRRAIILFNRKRCPAMFL